MNLERFVAEREPGWNELEHLLRAARRRPERLGPQNALRLGRLYRAAAAHLALARRRWPGDPVVRRLETLVARARVAVYETQPRRTSVVQFFARTYWQRIRERPVLLVLSAVLLFGPAFASGVWAAKDPARALGFAPAELRSVTEPREPGQDLGLSGGEQAAMSSFIFTNNIRVSFLAFAAGITAGLGTASVLLFNGAFLGTATGLAISAGNAVPFFELVTAHGVLELSCIVATGAAGLRIGGALVSPGYRRRSEALIAEGRAAIDVVLGTVPWLVIAGLVEGFLTPAGLGLSTALAIGVPLGAVYWLLVIRLGRPDVTVEPAPSR